MKVVILTLCILVASVVAQNTNGTNNKLPPQGTPTSIPGCANPPKGTKLSECCPNFPKFFSKEVMNNNCSVTCGKVQKSHMCCVSDCSLKTIGVTVNGKFDAAKGKSAIVKMAANNTAFTSELIGKIVEQCISTAPNKLQDWQSRAPADMTPTCSNDSSLNMVISGCIRRELFFQCPGLKTTDNCKALVDFGKGCAFFPFHDGPIGGGKRRPDGGDGSKPMNGTGPFVGPTPSGNSTEGSKPFNFKGLSKDKPANSTGPSGGPKPSGISTPEKLPVGTKPAGTTKTAPAKPTGKPTVTKPAVTKKPEVNASTKKL